MNLKFYENPSTWSRVLLCRWTDGQMDRRTDRHDKLIVAFRNFAKAPEIAAAWGIRKIQKLDKRYACISL